MKTKSVLYLTFIVLGILITYLLGIRIVGVSMFSFFCALFISYFGWLKVLTIVNLGALFDILMKWGYLNQFVQTYSMQIRGVFPSDVLNNHSFWFLQESFFWFVIITTFFILYNIELFSSYYVIKKLHIIKRINL